LISPIEWTDDSWPVLASKWPSNWDRPIKVDWPLSDEFDGQRLGMQWQSLGQLDTLRYQLADGQLAVQARGIVPGDSFPLTVNPRDLAYEVEAELVLDRDVTAGLVLFYSPRAYLSIGLSSDGKVLKHVAKHPDGTRVDSRSRIAFSGKRIRLKLVNHRQDASYYFSEPGGGWRKIEYSDDISGFQHNFYGGFISVRPGIYAAGEGKAVFNYFRYRSIEAPW